MNLNRCGAGSAPATMAMASATTTTSTAPAAPRLEQPFQSVQPPVMNGADAVRSATHEQLLAAKQAQPLAASGPAAAQPKGQAVNLALAAKAVRTHAVGRGQPPQPMTCPAPAAALQHQLTGQRIVRLAFPRVRPIAPRTLLPQVLLLPQAMPA